MHDDLFVGSTIYHKTGRTKAIIADYDHNYILVELSKEIASMKRLTLPITHIGEWLFFDANDVELSPSVLANNPQYLKYGNKLILEAIKENAERKNKTEDEEKRRLQELARQKETELKWKHMFRECSDAEYQLKKEFIDILKSEYMFDGFHHYTDFSNLIDIMGYGFLLSRNEAHKYGFSDAARQSVIYQTDPIFLNYVRFYYKEKTPTIYDNEGIKVDNCIPHMPIPVLMIFDENIINNRDVAFTSGCGGSKYTQVTSNVQTAMGFDWKTVFSRGSIPTDDNSIASRGYDLNKRYVNNKRNAEFLFNKQIDIKHLKSIIFRSPADLKHAISVLGDNVLYAVNAKKFNNHRNYLNDYNFVYIQDHYEITLVFNLSQSQYSHELIVTNENDLSEKIDICTLDSRINTHLTPYINTIKLHYNPADNRHIKRIEYLMNGHICALWEDMNNDKIL